MTPIWLIPPLALFLAANHFRAFWQVDSTNPSKLMWLAKAIVELFFAGVYTWLTFAPVEFSMDRAEIVRFLVLVMFGTNAAAVIIEKNYLYHLVQRIQRALKKQEQG